MFWDSGHCMGHPAPVSGTIFYPRHWAHAGEEDKDAAFKED